MKRKLPVYILIDSSSSMTGEPIQAVNNGVKLLIRALRKNPQALEMVSLSFIEYNSIANVLLPMTKLPQVQEPVFKAEGSTSLGAGLDLLADSLKKDVVMGDKKREEKGDYKPLVFHLTDGYPNDDWENALSRFDRRRVNFILSCGVPGADRSVLERVSGSPEYVLELESASEEELSKFFKYVTYTIEFASQKIPQTGDETIAPNSLPSFKPSEASKDVFF